MTYHTRTDEHQDLYGSRQWLFVKYANAKDRRDDVWSDGYIQKDN